MLRLLFCILLNIFISSLLIAGQVNYTVKAGDSLYSIASKHSMDINEMLQINKIKNIDEYKLKAGQKLKVIPNVIFRLAYDENSKSYAMLKLEKDKTIVGSDEDKQNNILKEKEGVIAKDNVTVNQEKIITARVSSISSEYYTVVSGDTLYGIAFKHDMKVGDFLALNDIKDSSKYKLLAGTKLRVKKAGEVKQVVANNTVKNNNKDNSIIKKVEKTEYYTAVKGDTLYGIAFKHDMKVGDFLALNDIKDSSKYNLLVGNKLKIKKIVEEKIVVANNTLSKPENDTVKSVVSNKSENIATVNNNKGNSITKKVEKIEYYTAVKGDTLYGIAFKHDMKVGDFLALNDIKDSSKYNLLVGNKLKIKKIVEEKIVVANNTPSKPENDTVKSVVSNKSENTARANNNRLIEIYTAKNADTLSQIAEYFGMDLIDLYVLNKLDNKYVLKVGDKLYIYNRVATEYNTIKYTVKSGDTLYSIARNNSMSLNELLDINSIDMKKYTLQSGSSLKVYKKESVATAKVDNQKDIKSRIENISTSDKLSTTQRPSINLSWPHRGSITVSYGVRKDKIANRGITIAGNSGDKVSAAEEGIVEYVGTIRGFGNVVIIKHENNYTTSYAHLSSTATSIGDFVNKGDKIGAVGSSGVVNKNELYFKVSHFGMPINPMSVLPKS